MNKAEARELLTKATRDEVHSSTSKDIKIYWELDGVEVASADIKEDTCEVAIYSDETLFTGQNARELIEFGQI